MKLDVKRRLFFQRYLSAKVLPIWIILLIDIFIIIISFLFAFLLRYNADILLAGAVPIERTILWALVVNLVFFRIFHTYSNVLRFSSFVDIMRIFLSLSLAYGLLVLLSLFISNPHRIASVSLFFIAYVINFSLMSFSRVMAKMFFDQINFDSRHRVNVFIYGAKEAGVHIAKSLRVNLRNHYRLRGFIADESELVGKVVLGVKVYPNDENLFNLLETCSVNTIIISPAKMSRLTDSEEFTDELLKRDISLLTAPPLREWRTNLLNPSQIKQIQIEDLLQRRPIEVDLKKIASHLEGKRVLITGAAGSIGSEIMRQVAAFNPFHLILIDQAETPLHDVRLELQEKWCNITAHTIIADIANPTRMEQIFANYKPQYIFHAAAYKHVPMMEDNVSESVQTNVGGTKILADLAVKYNAEKFVMISTDKAVNPTNIMGCSKRLAEIYVQSLAKKIDKNDRHITRFITTRFGNVLGSNGSVIPLFRRQIEQGGPVTVTHPEIIRYFMTIPEACKLVLEAGSMGNGGEIYLFDMGKPVKIVDLAKRMINLSGRTDVKITFTGLRHGEKLYEELLNNTETTKPTYHEKIMIANVREYDYEEVNDKMERLIDLSYSYETMEIVKMMKMIVPEYKSLNSEFEVLDEVGRLDVDNALDDNSMESVLMR